MLLWLGFQKVPRTLLAAELLAAVAGPICWLVVLVVVGSDEHSFQMSPEVKEIVGPLFFFVAIPRIMIGRHLLAVEVASILLVRTKNGRALLALAMLMDVIPMSIIALQPLLIADATTLR